MAEEHPPRDNRGSTKFAGSRSIQALRRRSTPNVEDLHPGLIPGISVEKTRDEYPTNYPVFGIALVASISVLLWAILAPDNLNTVGTGMQAWVTSNFGWFFTSLVILIMFAMLIIAVAPTGNIRLGHDNEAPTYSRASWISMLFAAGLGIMLIFYGPLEPLSHFLSTPPAFDVEAGSAAAIQTSLAQTILHQAFVPWSMYALLGGALAYATYRKGRLPLISSLFEPVFPDGSNRVLGKVIDIFAVLVTLFGTATSMGIGALQIQMGTEIVTGWDTRGNAFLAGAVTLLTVLFIISAVSGVKKGIRLLSNVNMGLVIFLGLFALFAGPTVFLLDQIPAAILTFLTSFGDMLGVNASRGPEEAEFMTSWTTMYWAWWLSWAPFVGIFVAKISRGRSIREFVFVVIFIPSLISVVWYVIFGGNAIYQVLNNASLSIEGSGENVMFDVLGNLPLGVVTTVLALIAVIIFFTTAADSATIVMGSMSQTGRPDPSRTVTIIWGVALGAISLFLLLAGGENAVSGLQSIMVTCALPFAVILAGVLYAWIRELQNDPYMIRRRYERQAIAQGVRRGIAEHGDDFVFGAEPVPTEEGAGANFESANPTYREWYTKAGSELPDTPVPEPEKP